MPYWASIWKTRSPEPTLSYDGTASTGIGRDDRHRYAKLLSSLPSRLRTQPRQTEVTNLLTPSELAVVFFGWQDASFLLFSLSLFRLFHRAFVCDVRVFWRVNGKGTTKSTLYCTRFKGPSALNQASVHWADQKTRKLYTTGKCQLNGNVNGCET